MAFDFIAEFKKLCVQLQKEDVAIYFEQAKKMNDMDQELQELIGKFNLAKFNLNIEKNKQEGKDYTVISKYEAELSDLYEEIMANDSMVAYSEAKADVDRLVQHTQAILTCVFNGGNPMLVELPDAGCTGSCSSCSGCH